MKPDPLLVPIREARRRISAEFGHDARRLVGYYRERERRLRAEGKHRFASVPLPSAAPAEDLALREEPPQT